MTRPILRVKSSQNSRVYFTFGANNIRGRNAPPKLNYTCRALLYAAL